MSFFLFLHILQFAERAIQKRPPEQRFAILLFAPQF
jgi:hypothetical protein